MKMKQSDWLWILSERAGFFHPARSVTQLPAVKCNCPLWFSRQKLRSETIFKRKNLPKALYKNVKITYLFHCFLSRKTLIKSKQIHFYMFLIGSEHEPVVIRSNWFCQSQSKNARHKSIYSKASLLPCMFMKKACTFLLKLYTSFCVFHASFLEFSYSCFISFNFSIFVSLAMKNTTALISN
jgi:hypothetical protein